MINRQALLADLQKFLQRIEADLLERSESTEVPEVPAALHAEYEKAAKAERTAQNYEDWRTDTITQAAAAWVLSCVFVRFLEDNSLIDPPKIAGPGERLARARDEHELYFRSHPQHTDREYLLSIFSELAKLPGTKDIFGEHNAINDLPNWLSGDAAGELLSLFQRIDASTGELVHDFTDPTWDTRFLGDLYQDLSASARAKFALLQTPDFVEEFILDRTLEPALDEYGLVPRNSSSNPQAAGVFRMIDPACGSGHFVMGSFSRILKRWLKKEPGVNARELVQRALNSVNGVDINPFAVAIARFRMLLEAMKCCSIVRLVDAPGFTINLACGDSLYHGRQRQLLFDGIETDESHYFKSEDAEQLKEILKEGSYHAVVANPPYITVSDQAVNRMYRELYSTCHRAYSLAVPFMQRCFALACRQDGDGMPAGFVGQITATGFMKREFGKKLIEEFLPTVEVSHYIDTSGVVFGNAGFGGTSTMILLGINRAPISNCVRSVMGLKGEPGSPADPRFGQVWSSIIRFIDQTEIDTDFVSVRDLRRDKFHTHPWSLGGGGASELKTLLDDSDCIELGKIIADCGATAVTREDEVYRTTLGLILRKQISRKFSRPMIDGENVREWGFCNFDEGLFPYDESTLNATTTEFISRYLWPFASQLRERVAFGKTQLQHGKTWFEYSMMFKDRLRPQYRIVQAFIATHNHYVLDRTKKVFNRSAPVITFQGDVQEDTVLCILGLLNSSTACFWMKQVFHCHGAGGGTRVKAGKSPLGDDRWESHYEYDTTKLKRFPVPRKLILKAAAPLEKRAQDSELYKPAKVLARSFGGDARRLMNQCEEYSSENLCHMIFMQEDLDWESYQLYGLHSENLSTSLDSVPVRFGERAFEIVMARKLADESLTTTWFERHGCEPVTEVPDHWPEEYKDIVKRRIEVIETNPYIALIEQPEYKRRWNTEPWGSQLERALREWLLLRLETYFDFDGRMSEEGQSDKGTKGQSGKTLPLCHFETLALYSIAQLADAARRDSQFMEVGELYRDDPAFDVQALVEELVLAESVPHLPILRYKDSGIRKRAEWEKTWDLQRVEDKWQRAKEAEGQSRELSADEAEVLKLWPSGPPTPSVPPKYTSADFISTGGARYWSLRGKLDVPKERWISFPHCEGPDGTLVLCWAGYDHLQQAQAISAYYVRVQTEFGGSDDPRLIPLLASLIELLPWLKQWHNEPNPSFDCLRMGDYFEGFVNEEARALGKTLDEIRAWSPPKGQRGRVAKGQSVRKKGQSRKGSKGQSEEGTAEA